MQSFWKIFSTGLSTDLWVTRLDLYAPPFRLGSAIGPGSGSRLDLDLSRLSRKPRGLSIFEESRSVVLTTGLGTKNPQPGFRVGDFFVFQPGALPPLLFGTKSSNLTSLTFIFPLLKDLRTLSTISCISFDLLFSTFCLSS